MGTSGGLKHNESKPRSARPLAVQRCEGPGCRHQHDRVRGGVAEDLHNGLPALLPLECVTTVLQGGITVCSCAADASSGIGLADGSDKLEEGELRGRLLAAQCLVVAH